MSLPTWMLGILTDFGEPRLAKTLSLVASVNLHGNVKGENNKSYNTYLGVAPATLRTEGSKLHL